MKAVLGFLTVVAGVIITGEALMCDTCKAVNEKDCSGKSVKCENEGDVCARIIEHNILYGDSITTIYKGCWNQTLSCGNHLLVSVCGFEISIYGECCKEDNCNCGKIEMPPKNTTKTGLSCKTCFAERSLECTAQESIDCIGNQGECLEYSGIGARPGKEIMDYAFSGCTTTGSCMIGLGALVGTKALNPNGLKCFK